MVFRLILILAAMLGFGTGVLWSQGSDVHLEQRQWFVTRTAHFNIHSCGSLADTYKLAARLEQFCEVYAMLAGTNAVVSQPIVVMAFPDEDSLKPFLPLYQGQPANLSGFFTRSSDENLIVLALPNSAPGSPGMEVIFHEYAHLLFRHNDQIWPLWLKEGMAEIYSTFETTEYEAQIARPINHHLRLMAHESLMPLQNLFAVTHDSPEYNESTRQGIFYAESWLLTHYLMAGDNPAAKAHFGNFTQLLRQGQLPEQAFTNALRTSLPEMETELRNYFERGEFTPITLTLSKDAASPIMVNSRVMTPVEVYFSLGDELLRIHRFDDAEKYFERAKKLAPASPLPYEGFGLLAAQRDKHEEAMRDFAEAVQLGSTSFLAYYIYAQEKYNLTADPLGRYAPLKGAEAEEIPAELEKSIELMPNFARAHELLGFFELVQGQNLTEAEEQSQIAVQMEPENPSYLLTLAQVQFRERDPAAARRTLEPLLLPNANAQLRASAESLLQEMKRADFQAR
jgi:tetratricopeptide (TPR) repeat protein